MRNIIILPSIMSIEDGIADSFLGVENEYSDGPRLR